MGDQTDASGETLAPPNLRDNTQNHMNMDDYLGSEYKRDHSYRGTAVVINNQKFDKKKKLSERTGSAEDYKHVCNLVDKMSFERQRLYQDLTAKQMKEILLEVSEGEHGDSDCFFCIILSHGKDGYIKGTDGEDVAVQELMQYFKADKCSSLAGKPKLFVLQACSESEFGINVAKPDGTKETAEERKGIVRIPTEADFLIAHSIIPGFLSWKGSTKPSWFIESFCEVFNKKFASDMDVQKMMTWVKLDVEEKFQKEDKNMHDKSDILPCITSTLTKKWILKKK